MRAGPATVLAAVAAACLVVGGCTGASAPPGGAGDAPVATPPARVFTPPVGRPGQVALVAMGSTVRGEGLDGGAVALLTGRGPQLDAQGLGVVASSSGTTTLRVEGVSGTLTVAAGDLLSRDDAGRPVTLDVTPAAVTVTAGQVQTLTVRGTWPAGRAYLAWLVSGRPVATWTFDVELD